MVCFPFQGAGLGMGVARQVEHLVCGQSLTQATAQGLLSSWVTLCPSADLLLF